MLGREYMQLALAAGLLVGASAPLVGTFVVARRMSLIGDGLGHVAFAGVTLGVLLGITPLGVGLVLAVAGAVVVDEIRNRFGTAGDLALAILFYSGLAAGVVFASAAGAMNANLFTYLFGSILTVTRWDVAVMAALATVVSTAVVLLRRSLFALVLDEDLARVSGLPVRRLNRVLLVLVALIVGLGMRVVGVLLVAALLVLPVAVAQTLARSFTGALVVGAAAGATAVVTGLAVAYYADLAPGGTIVLAAVGLFLLAQGAGRVLRPAG